MLDANCLSSAFTSKKRGGKGCHCPLFSLPFVSWVQKTGLHLHPLFNKWCLCLLRPIPPIWAIDQDQKFLTMGNDCSTCGIRAFVICNTMYNTLARTSEDKPFMLAMNFYASLCISCTLFPL